MKKFKERKTLNPIMTFIILIAVTIIASGILSLIGVSASYDKIDPASSSAISQIENVENLFSLSGVKYIFSSTVANFASFAPLIMLIIILFGIGIMEKSGFLKTAFSLLTKHCKKKTVTFVLVLFCLCSSLGGELWYVVFIPLSALLFLHGRRNPLIGIITSFAGLTCGSGLSAILTATDSSLLKATLLGASRLDANYTLGIWSFSLIMVVAIIVLAFVITKISEDVIAPKLGKYEFAEEEEETHIGKSELRGLIFGIGVSIIYLIIIIYSIIPGLPLSGSLLDKSQVFYIDKLFSYSSFFSDGFVFIITLLFVIWGLFYGIGARTIKNNNDLATCLGHSLDGIGKPIVLIFFAATFISIFKKSNIGLVIISWLSGVIKTTSFQGLPLIVLLFIFGAISTLFLPSILSRWTIISGSAVPVLMNAGISPEFSQVIFRFAESFTIGLTPLLAYYIIYLAYLEKYNKSETPITLFKSIGYQMPYSFATGGILLVILIAWYLLGIPIGIGGFAVL